MNKVPVLLLAAVLLSACNIPSSKSVDPQIATAAALTVQSALEAATPLASPAAAFQQTTTPAISTPTFIQPMASVEDVTNCRKGPGTNYERVTQLMPLESVRIVGFYPPNYWVVSTKDGDCWLSGEFATPSGSFAAVPTVAGPPTPQGGGPKAATFPKSGWTFFCYTGKADITLSWNDNAENESGYRIVRNGEVVADLSANTTYFEETIPLLSGESVEYKIRAYNLAGNSDSPPAKIACP